MAPTGIAVIGAGPWGLTLTGAFASLPQVEVRWICDLDDDRRARAGAVHAAARLSADLDDALRDPGVAAVVVAVEPARHHAVGMRALAAGKHLFVEKPLALSARDAGALHAAAAARGLVLDVGHLLLHHPAVARAKAIVADRMLGEPLTFRSRRATPGAPRRPGSAWWALAPHDVSLALHLFAGLPKTVTATGAEWGRSDEDNAATAVLHFSGGRTAHIQVARFAARKRRVTAIEGTRGALTFDELATAPDTLRLWTPQQGTVTLPCDLVDALRAQCIDFAAAVARGDARSGNGAHAVEVVAVLEAGERSMRCGGAPQTVTVDAGPVTPLETASFEAA
ncbi:MAG TPA: Gfo/Idh/MocA family oxidoreductase [Polyangia bacterium]|nr:Gfo/Idh/MocA family oxidoreductase [Polyangia bacterium]